ncbi:MAG: HD-GYP domain-containing protein, partial [Deferrisomatales bacterium]
ARAVGFTEDEVRVISYAAELHDVGKIHTPSGILRKAGLLTPEELRVMRQHAVQGERIIGSAQGLATARRIAGAHHENWDGSGYPRGLAGDQIPREAQLVKVVDVYDALRSERPYKDPMGHDAACRVLLEGDGRTQPEHFAPEMLEAFRTVQAEFQRIYAEIRPWG